MADHEDAVARQEFENIIDGIAQDLVQNHEFSRTNIETDSKKYRALITALTEAYQAGSADRWVSVEDGLPEIGKEVLGGAFIEATFYDGHKTRNWQHCLQVWTGEKWIDSDSGEEDGATHWFPIPAPPKKEDSHE